jgi:hypothetical protein
MLETVWTSFIPTKIIMFPWNSFHQYCAMSVCLMLMKEILKAKSSQVNCSKEIVTSEQRLFRSDWESKRRRGDSHVRRLCGKEWAEVRGRPAGLVCSSKTSEEAGAWRSLRQRRSGFAVTYPRSSIRSGNGLVDVRGGALRPGRRRRAAAGQQALAIPAGEREGKETHKWHAKFVFKLWQLW